MTNPMPLGLEPNRFSGAQLTLVWALPAAQGRRSYLLWATVELFPSDVPAPLSENWTPESSYALPGEPSERVFLARVTVAPSIGLAWFARLASSGVWTKPDPKTHDLGETPDDEEPVARLLVEPPWPELTLVPEGRRFGAVPLDLKNPYLSSVLPGSSRPTEVWSASRREAAGEWMEARIGVAVAADTQLWGSAHLIVGNPEILQFSLSLNAAEDGQARGIVARTLLRAGTSYDGLGLTVLERRYDGWRLLYDDHLPGPSVSIPVTGEPAEVAAILRRGGQLLYVGEPRPFIRTIQLGMHVNHTQRRVTVERSDPAKSRTFSVALRGLPMRSMVGMGAPPDGVDALRSIRKRIESVRAARMDDQVWIRGDRDSALERLRRLLAQADDRLLFVDPYFGISELAEFVAAVPSTAVRIDVLGSAEGLRRPDGSGGGRRPLAPALRELVSTREAIRSGARVQPVSIRLMRGRPPGIHDRFLVVDRAVYLLGSSLNSFGVSGTMIVKLPHPERVLPELEAEFVASPTLEERLEEAEKDASVEE